MATAMLPDVVPLLQEIADKVQQVQRLCSAALPPAGGTGAGGAGAGTGAGSTVSPMELPHQSTDTSKWGTATNPHAAKWDAQWCDRATYYETLTAKDLADAKVDILIETVNLAEFHAAFSVLEPLHDDGKLHCIDCSGVPVYVGKLKPERGARQPVVAALIRTAQSSHGAVGSQALTQKVLPVLKPKLVCPVGVAFGTSAATVCAATEPAKRRSDNSTIHVGDVLVGTDLVRYDHVRNTDGVKEQRQPMYSLSDKVRLALEGQQECWSRSPFNAGCITLPQETSPRNPQVHLGLMLTGGVLYASEKAHTALVRETVRAHGYRVPLGGEMEGSGATYAVGSHDVGVPVVVIKAVVDWGISKTVSAKEFHAAAADAAFRFLCHSAHALVNAAPPSPWGVPETKRRICLSFPISRDHEAFEPASLVIAAQGALDKAKTKREQAKQAYDMDEEVIRCRKLLKDKREQLLAAAENLVKQRQATMTKRYECLDAVWPTWSDQVAVTVNGKPHTVKRASQCKAPSWSAIKAMAGPWEYGMIRQFVMATAKTTFKVEAQDGYAVPRAAKKQKSAT